MDLICWKYRSVTPSVLWLFKYVLLSWVVCGGIQATMTVLVAMLDHVLLCPFSSFECSGEYHAPLSCENLSIWNSRCMKESQTARYIIANTKPVRPTLICVYLHEAPVVLHITLMCIHLFCVCLMLIISVIRQNACTVEPGKCGHSRDWYKVSTFQRVSSIPKFCVQCGHVIWHSP